MKENLFILAVSTLLISCENEENKINIYDLSGQKYNQKKLIILNKKIIDELSQGI